MDRQRMILIFAGAWLSAALLTWFVFSRTSAGRSEPMVQVMAASRDLPAGTRLKKSDLKKISIPERDAPRTILRSDDMAVDRVLLHPVSAGEPVVTPKLSSGKSIEGVAALIQPGMRAISVPISDVTSAGGLIQPRSRVDVLFTRTGTMREAITSTIVQDVAVLSVGRMIEAAQQDDTKSSTPAPTPNPTQTRAATLMVTPEQASKIELAKNQGKVSLSLRNPLDKGTIESTSATAEHLDPQIFAGATRAIRSSINANIPNLRDDKVWNELMQTGGAPAAGQVAAKAKKPEPPPPPKYVVDVYHGDKHVQEIFQ